MLAFPPVSRAIPRSIPALALLLFTIALCLGQAVLAPAAQAATMSLDQCNGVGASSEGATTVMECTVVVVNTINGAHRGSTTTLTRNCLNGPCAPGNGTFVSHSTALVTHVSQCNGSDNDAAHPILCQVTITNNISAGTANATPRSAATVNQCVGSATGGGGSKLCGPFPANTTGATITQCNGSGTGGGGTVNCTVASASRISAAIPIKVNQCNGTGNPGGSVVTCSVRIFTNITPEATGSGSGSGSGTGSGTGTGSGSGSGSVSGAGVTGTASGSGTGISTGSQVSKVPVGGAQTGAGSTSGLQHGGLFGAGAALLIAAGGLALWRRRATSHA